MSSGGVTVALAGDTMLGRGVGATLAARPPRDLFSGELVDIVRSADLFVLNLECCISPRGERWPDPHKPFFFRAPPQAIEVLTLLGVDCVSLANNHALDYGPEALVDTLALLDEAGIAHVGAGPDVDAARRPADLGCGAHTVRVVGFTDHPYGFRAGPSTPGVAFTDLGAGIPGWVEAAVAPAAGRITLVTPHWGPNMTTRPVSYVRRAAAELVGLGVSAVAGHSSHVFHGIQGRVAFDLGDFIDDYAVDPLLRNDLGILVLAHLVRQGLPRWEVVPLELGYAHTRVARGKAGDWVRSRLRRACAEMGTEVTVAGGRLLVGAA